MTNQDKLQQYQKVMELGTGATSKVDLVEDISSHKKYAMKIIKYKPKILKQIERETSILQKISMINSENSQCPYFVQLHDIIKTNDKIILILEYISGGDLNDQILNSQNGYFSEGEARYYFQQLIEAITFLHSNNIYHRDLKLENLLVDSNGNLRITDFGLSIISNNDMSTHCGTPYYVAPELFLNQYYRGAPADIWSCGIVLYTMLCGEFPFSGQTFEQLGRNIIKCELHFPDYLSKDSIDLLSHILQPDPNQRFTLDQIKDHTWYKDYLPQQPLMPTDMSSIGDLFIDPEPTSFQDSLNDRNANEESNSLSSNDLMELDSGSFQTSINENESSSVQIQLNTETHSEKSPHLLEGSEIQSILNVDETDSDNKTEHSEYSSSEPQPLETQNSNHQEIGISAQAFKNTETIYSFILDQSIDEMHNQIMSFLSLHQAKITKIVTDKRTGSETLKISTGHFISKLRFQIILTRQNNQTGIVFEKRKGKTHKYQEFVQQFKHALDATSQ